MDGREAVEIGEAAQNIHDKQHHDALDFHALHATIAAGAERDRLVDLDVHASHERKSRGCRVSVGVGESEEVS